MKNQTQNTNAAREAGQMSGQEKYTCGMELRWVAGTSEQGPAKIYNSTQACEYDGTYDGAVKWLGARNLRPV